MYITSFTAPQPICVYLSNPGFYLHLHALHPVKLCLSVFRWQSILSREMLFCSQQPVVLPWTWKDYRGPPPHRWDYPRSRPPYSVLETTLSNLLQLCFSSSLLEASVLRLLRVFSEVVQGQYVSYSLPDWPLVNTVMPTFMQFLQMYSHQATTTETSHTHTYNHTTHTQTHTHTHTHRTIHSRHCGQLSWSWSNAQWNAPYK